MPMQRRSEPYLPVFSQPCGKEYPRNAGSMAGLKEVTPVPSTIEEKVVTPTGIEPVFQP